MKIRQIPVALMIVAGVTGASSVAYGNEARQYCEEMYPADSYEAGERAQYISECIAVTDDGYSDDTDSADESSESNYEEYYEGTVEDYVNSVEGESESEEFID